MKQTKEQKSLDPDRLPAWKLLAWSGAGISAAANFIILGYVSIYATDTLGISPAIIGVMILISSFTNVAGSLAASWIVDRSPETRWGKARPYEFAVVGIWLATWLLFSTPAGFDEIGRIIWLFVTYISINVVFDALLRANDLLYMARAFANRQVYGKVAARGGIFTTLGAIIVSVTLPIALGSAGKSPEGWSFAILMFAVPLTLIGMTRFFFVKEEFKTADAGSPPVKFKDLLAALGSNRWIWLLCGLMLLSSTINGANMVTYYFRYIVGNLALQGALAALGIIVLPVILLFPRLMRRFALSQIHITGAALGIIGAGFYAIANGNLALVFVGALFGALGALPIAYLSAVMILDLSAYNEWKGKRRLESTFGALVGMCGRIGIGLAGLLVGAVLAASGYDGTQETQSPAAEAAITALFAGIPALAFALIIVLMVIYGRFDRKILPVVHADLDARHGGHVEVYEVPVIPPAAVPIPGSQVPTDQYVEFEAVHADDRDAR